MIRRPTEPTGEQCSANERLPCGGFACWYPQMGGYVVRCVVYVNMSTPDQSDGDNCFEAYVWHDGEFPFAEDDDREPIRLHHCSPKQFARFSEDVLKCARREKELKLS